MTVKSLSMEGKKKPKTLELSPQIPQWQQAKISLYKEAGSVIIKGWYKLQFY